MEGILRPPIIRVGLIGLQRRLFHLLGELFSSYPHQIEVVALTGLSTHSISIAKELFGEDVKEVDSISELLAIDSIQWVFVCASVNENSSVIKEILKADKNVFCEKPLLSNVSNCVEIQNILQTCTKNFLCGFVWRYVPFYQEVYNIISQGGIGKFFYFNIYIKF